jgi:hypothetical protein
MEFQRKAYATTKAHTFVKESVETIYYSVRKVSVERSSSSFYHTISNILDHDEYIDIDDLATSIREELVTLFPDFRIDIGIVNDGYNRSRFICVNW